MFALGFCHNAIIGIDVDVATPCSVSCAGERVL